MRRRQERKNILEIRTQEILRLLKIRNTACRVNLVSRDEMERVRKKLITLRQFRGREADTIKRERCVSVLAFKEPKFFPHPETKKRVMGEIYINKGYADSFCFIRDKSSQEEIVTRLLIHGILHLRGFRHVQERDRIRMERQEEILWHHVLS